MSAFLLVDINHHQPSSKQCPNYKNVFMGALLTVWNASFYLHYLYLLFYRMYAEKMHSMVANVRWKSKDTSKRVNVLFFSQQRHDPVFCGHIQWLSSKKKSWVVVMWSKRRSPPTENSVTSKAALFDWQEVSVMGNSAPKKLTPNMSPTSHASMIIVDFCKWND